MPMMMTQWDVANVQQLTQELTNECCFFFAGTRKHTYQEQVYPMLVRGCYDKA